ncbi:hypothetical protein [Halobellus ordinarius]|uniref:hypothetical protein n=1 Tax=Halobellus ordinarius TaxID=3075120 RepID=UPI0028800D33|nr:hypothetical protein [Halobellus sp. ZY16]
MNISIFAEGAQTTADAAEASIAKDYFHGLFEPVSNLEQEISKYAETELHILSDEYGYLTGEMPIQEITSENASSEESRKEFANAIVSAGRTADIIVVLLSASTFKDTVGSRWDDILSTAQENTIWCFGASKGALDAIDIPALESEVKDIIIYQRTGVAPIGRETRTQLLNIVREGN